MEAKATDSERVALLAKTFGKSRAEMKRIVMESGLRQLEYLALQLLTQEQERRRLSQDL